MNEKTGVGDEILMKRGSKYWPLFDYLQQCSEAEIILSISEIESVLDRELPKSARQNRGWWSNRSSGAVQALAWMEAGFHVADIDLPGEQITFRKPTHRYTVERKGDTVLWNSDLIKGLRTHMGVSQAELAEQLGVRQQTISEWETGIYAPSLKISKYLNLFAREVQFKYSENK